MIRIPTATGDITPKELGNVLSHEHMLIYSPNMRLGFGERWFPLQKAIDRAVHLLSDAKARCGIDTVIDGTPLDLGRNLQALREISRRSSVNILLSSGLYITEEHFMHRRTPSAFAKAFIDECTNGIADSGIKPAMLKCATGPAGFTPINRLLLDTMSLVQTETGLPLFAHNHQPDKTGYEQLRIFEKNRVNLEKVIIGHCSDTADIPYLLDLAKSGCFLGFDRIFPQVYEQQAAVIFAMIEAGYEDRLLLSHDFFAFSDSSGDSLETQSRSERDFTTVHLQLLPALKALGATDTQIHKLTYENPQKLFT